MTFLLYIVNTLFARTESAFGKYCASNGGDKLYFNTRKMLAASGLSLILSFIFGISLHSGTLVFAPFYGATLALSTFAGVKALSLGNMAIASMLASFSLIIPCLWGLVFLDERLSIIGFIALVLIAASIILLNVKKGGGKISPACWFYSILTMLSNGIGSVIQKQHQTLYPGEYRIEFTLFSTIFAFLVFAVIVVIRKARTSKNLTATEEAKTLPKNLKRLFLIFGLTSGVCSCIASFSILLLASYENATILFPIISATNAATACLVGRIVFKERLTINQIISIALGIAAVVMLKI